MRNLKRVLALAMALVMTLGMMVIGANAASYTDAGQIDAKYSEAIDILTGMGVFQGMETGAFAPKEILNRAQASALVYRVLTGDVTDAKKDLYDYTSFDDAKEGAWYTGYVTYAANGGYIKGYGDGTFGPYDQVTGVQVLAIMLRAIGYGQNGEFEGAAWKDNTLTTAHDLGLLAGIATNDLDKGASRELVAQLLFNAISIPSMVTYSPALGYTDRVSAIGLGPKNPTLAEKVFNLACTDDQDDWGRPSVVWYNDKNGDDVLQKVGTNKETVYATFAEIPVASYTTKVDECDIAEDIGLKKSATIEAAYIDGETYKTTDAAVTTNRYGTINPTATTSYVGAQGRITEVYDMGNDTYRIVEINTYLAQVTSVTAATTDKNGHTTAGYSTLTVYTNAATNAGNNTNVGVILPSAGTTKTVYTTDTSFAKNSYVLVTANNASMKKTTSDTTKVGLVATIEQTAPVASGTLTKYTSSTTTVGNVTYDNADKYVLGNNGKTLGDNYDVFVDQYGNIIGLIESTTNYLVIESISWKQDKDVTKGGYALADLVLADGTKVSNVLIAKINSKAATNMTDTAGDPSIGTVSDDWTNNTKYYDHLTTYSVNSDGSYNIGDPCEGTDLNNCALSSETNTIKNSTNSVVANDNTVYLVKNLITKEYTVYQGRADLPSMTGAKICYLTNAKGYATVVVVYDYTLASNTFVAYIDNVKSTSTTKIGPNTYYEFDVYKLGATESTTVLNAYNKLSNDSALSAITGDGFYEITVNASGVVTGATAIVAQSAAPALKVSTDGGYRWDVGYGKADDSGVLQVTETKNGATTLNDYNIGETVFLQLNRVDGTLIDVEEVDSDAAIGEKVFVAYHVEKVAGANVDYADYVYIVSNNSEDVNTPAADYSISNVVLYAGTTNFKVQFKTATALAGTEQVIVTIYTEDGAQVGATKTLTATAGASQDLGTGIPLPTYGANYRVVITIKSGTTTLATATSGVFYVAK